MQDWRCFDDKSLPCPPEGCPIMYGCARARGWREGLEPPVGYFDVAMLENLISRRMQDHWCPWSGKRNCGCTTYPQLWDGRMPAACESHLTLATAEVHVKARRVSPELTEKVNLWVAAGRPDLEDWLGEKLDDEPSAGDG